MAKRSGVADIRAALRVKGADSGDAQRRQSAALSVGGVRYIAVIRSHSARAFRWRDRAALSRSPSARQADLKNNGECCPPRANAG
ncbi:hypothetical protein M8494_15790 [Serratia ureilytica]